MTANSGAGATPFLLGLSALIMVIALVSGGLLILQNEQGGFLPNLGLALGLLVIATGNLLSWMVNLFCWYRARARWLTVLLSLQTLPAAALIIGLGIVGTDQILESRASEQRARLYKAIEADDMAALQEGLAGCGERCREFFTDQRKLMLASLHGAHQAARHFLEEGATLSTGAENFYDGRTSLRTCEGTYLASLGPLQLAVANQDREMLELLWPVSGERARWQALWTAAQLDRLAMVTFMLHDKQLEEQESLLRAAAAGAALDVGRWLLETRPLELPAAEIQGAMTDLAAFMMESETPRSLSFGRLLMRHGADIHSLELNDAPALERAVSSRSKALAAQLLELGADPNSLSQEDRADLAILLHKPDRDGSYRRNTEGCVAP